MPIGRIFVAGIVFLFLTILINALANSLRLTSWYTFLGVVGSVGIGKALGQLSVASLLWLFVGYPLALGMLIYLLKGVIK